jgi:hypothetical protein
MKKFLSMIALVTMLFCVQNVYAQEPQTGFATLTYTVDDSFMVYIPDSISVGQTAQLYASQINIDPSKHVYVRISNMGNDGVTITSVNDSSSTLSVLFRDGEGNTLNQSNTLVGTFSESDASLYLTSYIDYDGNAVAGDYTGVVYFDISCE